MARLFFFFFSVTLLMAAAASAHEFPVGGSQGWIVPAEDYEPEPYNRWAIRNRFHVGDSLYFKYVNDSVLVVNREAYGDCDTADPLLSFDDGNTTFRFERFGFFYFISGAPGHCQAGQRLIVRVMVHPDVDAAASPAPAPGTQPGGGSGSGSSSASGSGSGSSSRPNHSGSAMLHSGFTAAMGGLLGVVVFLI